MKILSLIIHPSCRSKPIRPLFIFGTQIKTCLTQSRHRNVVRALLKWSMWHQWFNHNFMTLREYFLCGKKLTLLNSSPRSYRLPPLRRVPWCICVLSSARKQGAAHACSTSAAPHAYVVVLSIMVLWWRGGEELLNKVVISVVFAHKMYAVLTTFCALTMYPCCLWRVRKLSDLIKNILICVPKMNEGLTGLERHEGE